MKYLKEAEELMKDLFFEKWMDNDDWNCFLKHIERQTGASLEYLSLNIEEGVNNGYSLSEQIRIIKIIFKK